jgi:hypothetical protein
MTDTMGRDVRTANREDVGKIEDLCVDVGKDKVVFAMISTGGIQGMGDKLIAVPLPAINLHRADHAVVVRVDRNKIKTAPSFDRKDWPDLADARWTRKVREHYGVGDNDNFVYGYDDIQDTDRTMRGWEYNGPYNRRFDPERIETASGKITAIDRDVPMPGMAPAIVLKVQQDNDKVATVHLGPVWFLDRQQNMFKVGDQVKATGSSIEIDGKPLTMATEVERGGRTMMLRRTNGDPVWDAWSRSNDIRGRPRE